MERLRVNGVSHMEIIEMEAINQIEPHTMTLMYKMGRKIYFSKGNQLNIKITTREDLDLFEGFICRRNDH